MLYKITMEISKNKRQTLNIETATFLSLWQGCRKYCDIPDLVLLGKRSDEKWWQIETVPYVTSYRKYWTLGNKIQVNIQSLKWVPFDTYGFLSGRYVLNAVRSKGNPLINKTKSVHPCGNTQTRLLE